MSALICLGPQCNGGSHCLRRCARGKCIQRVANRIVRVVKVAWGSRFAVLGYCTVGGSAFKELQIAL